jgi:hypothetical protein
MALPASLKGELRQAIADCIKRWCGKKGGSISQQEWFVVVEPIVIETPDISRTTFTRKGWFVKANPNWSVGLGLPQYLYPTMFWCWACGRWFGMQNNVCDVLHSLPSGFFNIAMEHGTFINDLWTRGCNHEPIWTLSSLP